MPRVHDDLHEAAAGLDGHGPVIVTAAGLAAPQWTMTGSMGSSLLL